MITLYCRSCDTNHPEDDFHRDRKAKTGRRSICKTAAKEVVTRSRKKAHYPETIVPDHVWKSNNPHKANRECRVKLALKLARSTAAAGEHRLAWNYVQYAECVGRGYVEPHPNDVRRVFGHGFGEVPEGVRYRGEVT
jgi:hypothetical protein